MHLEVRKSKLIRKWGKLPIILRTGVISCVNLRTQKEGHYQINNQANIISYATIDITKENM